MTRRGAIAILLTAAAVAALVPPGSVAADAAASRAACAGQSNANAPAGTQERVMLCLVNQARRRRGLAPLAAVSSLAKAAGRKSTDMIRCDEFSHEACGREFSYWMERFGYVGCRVAENIAWGSGSLGAPRSIFKAWMNSAGHRRNILGPYEDIGIGLQVGTIEGVRGAHVWTQQFGSRTC